MQANSAAPGRMDWAGGSGKLAFFDTRVQKFIPLANGKEFFSTAATCTHSVIRSFWLTGFK
jgi:hypothetical protein